MYLHYPYIHVPPARLRHRQYDDYSNMFLYVGTDAPDLSYS